MARNDNGLPLAGCLAFVAVLGLGTCIGRMGHGGVDVSPAVANVTVAAVPATFADVPPAPPPEPRRRTRRGADRPLPVPRSEAVGTGSCPCSARPRQVCVGPRGGRYCITEGGNRRYGL